MRRKKAVLVGLVIALVVVAAWSALNYRSRHDNLEWMQRTTGVRLPRDVRVLSMYDNGEYFLRGHVMLPAGTVTNFLQSYGFKPADSGKQRELGRQDAIDPKFMDIPQDADLFSFAGRSQKQTWSFILDKQSGHLWFTVQYPDLAGEAP